MLLIDALYIYGSGGMRLLEYLVKTLQDKDVPFYLLGDKRFQGELSCTHMKYINASLKNKYIFYRKHKNDFSKVLCFGNIPPLVRMPVPVYTYFHNINLLTLSESNSILSKVTSWLKRFICQMNKKHTDYWIVQTSNTAHELIYHLKEDRNRLKIMPFFLIPSVLSSLKEEKHGNDYVYISDYYEKAKGHEELLEAWYILHEKGLNCTLHLTISESNTTFLDKINSARKKGINVVNHGFQPFENILGLYKKSKAIVYPSHNESLGLGIVEAIMAGCDVVGADLPYLHAICKPSVVFDPCSAFSIVNAIIKYEDGESPRSELIIENGIDAFVDLLK